MKNKLTRPAKHRLPALVGQVVHPRAGRQSLPGSAGHRDSGKKLNPGRAVCHRGFASIAGPVVDILIVERLAAERLGRFYCIVGPMDRRRILQNLGKAVFLKKVLLFFVVSTLAAETILEAQFISAVNAVIRGLLASVGSPTRPVLFSANLVLAHGSLIANAPLDVLLNYVDGLKQAGAQRIEFNPGVASLADPNVMAKYDALVGHIRQLGLRLAINPEVVAGTLGSRPTFQDFQNAALPAYRQLAARYQPDNFVIVHDASTMDGRLGLTTNLAAWHNFILAAAPLIKAASPHTRVGAGGYLNGALPFLSNSENAYWLDFVRITLLDFMTMDIYNVDTFDQYIFWANLAHTNNKGVYIEETWAPYYLPSPLPPTALNPLGYLISSLDALSVLGPSNADFAAMDTNWLQAMSAFASFYGMEAVTPFTTEAFFALGTTGHDRLNDSTYHAAVLDALRRGKLTATANTYQAWSRLLGIKTATSLSSASYATVPSIFDPDCGTAANPCMANATVAPDELVSAFGSSLANATAVTPSAYFPTTLGGTTVTLVDSANTTDRVPLFSVAPLQVNYLVPPAAKPGPATVTIKSGDGAKTTGIVQVAAVAPGLYTANADGKGAAAAIAITAHPDGTQSSQPTFSCGSAAGSCAAQPISLGAPGDTVVVELFGTGLRHASAVGVQINGQGVPVLYAGPQGGYTGLDQINVQIPRSLAGSGPASVVVTVPDGVASNTVMLVIQ